MSYLFTDIEELKQYVGGGANLSLEMASLDPIQLQAAQNHIWPWLGEDLWQALVNDFNSPSAAQAALLPHVQRALGFLTLYEYAQIGGIQLSEAGFFRIENDHQRSAYKYQENQYRRWMLESGYENLEVLLRFLTKQADDYPLWKDNPAYLRQHESLLRYASEFRDAYSQYLSRYTFELLRPLVLDVEAFAVISAIGEPLYLYLLEQRRLDQLSDKEQTVIRLLQRAIANFTVEEGLQRNWVRLEGRAVVQTEHLEPQSYTKASVATMAATATKARHHDAWGNRHLARAESYLKQQVEDFPLYGAFPESQAATTEPEATSTSTTRRKIFRL